MSAQPLVDADARLAIRQQLDRNFLVEAAAGTGKTTELVQRIVATIDSGRGQLSSIVAVTFTEKAAGEMKLRIRTELDRALQDASADATRELRLSTALAELEVAKISTIHAFCADLLREYPVQAGVDPLFEVADAQRAQRIAEKAFDGWFERVVQDPPEGVRRVLGRRNVDRRGSSPRTELLDAVRKLIDTRDFDCPYRRPTFERQQAIEAVMAELAGLADFAGRAHSPSDPLARACTALADALQRSAALDADSLEAFLSQLLRDRSVWNDNKGRGTLYGRSIARADVIAVRTRVRAALEDCVQRCSADLAACLSRELSVVVQLYEAEKASQGALDFFDLLLLSGELLRTHDAVRNEVQAQFSHLFVDEFQDTDPVQAEILLLIAATEPLERDPWRVRPIAGKLFLVGDPKQSIYRFRRADVSLYERIKTHLRGAGTQVLELVTSFRALPAIQSFINAAFSRVMVGQPESGQAAYVPLASFRPARADQPAIVALPAPRPLSKWGRITNYAVNASLPDAVAAFVDWLVHRSGYQVLEHGADVPLCARHVCLLFRRFRNYDGDITREYVRALEARRIPHVLSGGRSFHMREEVMALRAVLDAIEWPDDELSVYATLRGPFVALSDDSLLAFRAHAGHLHPFGPVDRDALAESEREVAVILELLASLHGARNRRPIAQTLSAFLNELRAHAAIAIWPTGEQALGNVLNVLDLARSYEGRGEATSFRGFVEWLDEHAEMGTSADAAVLEESSEGVRIMTVHAAKGLEFPVVILCEPTASMRPEYASRHVDPERKLWAQPLCNAEPIELLEQRERVRDHDQAEIVRLAYVAATRAREMLVVPSCGDAPLAGWLAMLAPALHPAPSTARKPLGPGPGCPQFGTDSMVDRADHVPSDSVAPGEHVPEVGEHRVVWWDPNVLVLARPASGGLVEQELLLGDEAEQGENAGLRAYQAWRDAASLRRERAGQPSVHARSMTLQAVLDAPSVASPVEPRASDSHSSTAGRGLLQVVATNAGRGERARGARFGTLVHALLAGLPLVGPASDLELEQSARFLGRTLGANPGEVEHAVAAAQRVLAHPLWARVCAAGKRGEVYRETPIVLRTTDGTLLDGVVDLAFVERQAGARQVVLIDFKTDAEISDLTTYTAQLRLYAQALTSVFEAPVEQILFRV
jgi:ATP-dependent helicase/nuclease subunit A